MINDSAILHISDLHLLNFTPINDSIKYSYLNESNDYLIDFIDNVKTECQSNHATLKYIFITGDVANSGRIQEYDKALKIVNILNEKLNVSKENICIVPGNHDINWTDLDKYIEDTNYQDHSFLLHDVKFGKFKKFYHDNNNRIFQPQHPVVDLKVDNDNQLLILELNSNFYESQIGQNHRGCINHTLLKQFLEEKISTSYATYGKIVLLHHHHSTFIDEKIIKDLNSDLQANLCTWSKIEETLNKFDFHVFIHGHVHNDNSTAIDDGEINRFIGVGSLAKKDDKIINSYNLFFNKESSTEFIIQTYHYVDKNISKPYWQIQSGIKAKRDFTIYSPPINLSENNNTDNTIPFQASFVPEELGEKYSTLKYSYSDTEKISKNKPEIMKFIRENKLFKTGHFHWSEKFRTHGLIDLFSLINNKKCQDLIFESIDELIRIREIPTKSLLGVGFEGNVIGAFLSLNYPECQYTYITSSEDYFNEFEKRVVLENTDITIIEDVIFQADSLKKILNDNKNIVDKINTINLITLFFCGNKNDLDEIGKIPKLKFHYIFDEIKIEACPYKDLNKCPIVANNLDNYYKFY